MESLGELKHTCVKCSSSGVTFCTHLLRRGLYLFVRAFDFWKLFEEAGAMLVLFGVIGQVWAAASEPEERIGESSSMVPGTGLVFSLASLVGASDHVSTIGGTVIESASGVHRLIAE